MTRHPFILGLTGSIGMGKTTTAGVFKALGVPVWDADAAVHRLYASGGAALPAIEAICPEAVRASGVDRAVLKDWIARDDTALAQLNAVVHPLVAADRQGFVEQAAQAGHAIVIVDIPLLFETGGDRQTDATLVVTAPPEVQRKRVLERPGMTEDHLKTILASQMPDAEKRRRADYIIETVTPESAEKAVRQLLAELRERVAQDA